MLKEHSSFIKQALALLDCFLILIAFYTSYHFVSLYRQLLPILQYWVMIVGFIGFYLYFGWTRALFSILDFAWAQKLLGRIVTIFLSAGILGAAILFALPDIYSSRLLYGTFNLVSFLLIVTEKLFIRAFIVFIRRRNRNTTPIIIFGRGRAAAQLIREIYLHPEYGLRNIRTLDISTSVKQFEDILKNYYIEEVFFCIPRSITSKNFTIDPYLHICEAMGRCARVFLNIGSTTSFANWEYHRFLDRPTLIAHTVELDPDQLLFKRIFDICGSIVGLAILFVLFPFIALIIKLDSPGPVFFKQVRVGKNGKRFIMYKFRSMTVDAEEKKKELEAKNELKGAIFKIKDDPRITRVGKWLRIFSIDELPQFINIFKGEMSLVGTRPPTPEEVAKYQKWHHRRISIKPGITGLWQVSGRSKITNFDDVVKLDLKYIDSWSIWNDIKIIFKTIFILFARGQAY